VIGPAPSASAAADPPSDRSIVSEFCYSTEVAGLQRREAINAIARRHKLPARAVYRIVENAKHMGDDQ